MTPPIVVGIDGSEPADLAAEFAAELGARRRLEVALLHAFSWPLIYPSVPPAAEAPQPLPRTDAGRHLDAVAKALRERHQRLAIRATLIDGHPAGVLVDASRRASFLVVGHRGLGGLTEMLVGSVGAFASIHARCPVVVVRGRRAGADAPVVVGVDGSAGARAAARLAFEEASLRGTDLVVALATTGPSHPGRVDPIAASLAGIGDEFPDVKIATEVQRGESAAEMLAALAAGVGADLLVTGSRGIGGFRSLLAGSTSRTLIDHAPCALMIVPKAVTPA
jgi:nucleotide-binding universal stress UspA family protein